MAICNGCGGSYQNEFNFCPYCGRAKPDPEEINIQVNVTSSDRWEYCEIEDVIVKKGNEGFLGTFGTEKSKLKFVAEAIGPQGRYIENESSVFLGNIYNSVSSYSTNPTKEEKELAAAAYREYERLVQILIDDGWEAIPVKNEEALHLYWKEFQFRRRIK